VRHLLSLQPEGDFPTIISRRLHGPRFVLQFLLAVVLLLAARAASAAGLRGRVVGITVGDTLTLLTEAMLDRLMHHASVVQIGGDTNRLKDKRKGGIMQKPAEDTA